jgi:hypothetical protein
MRHCREGLVGVDYIYFFFKDDMAEGRESTKDSGETRLLVDWQAREVVHFQTISKVMYALNIPIRVGENDNFVAECHEALRELVDVRLYATSVRVEKIRDH